MEEKAKSGLKSALSFLKGDVLFYLAEAEKHETDTTEKLRIRLIKEAAEELSERIKTATEQPITSTDKTRERCGRCAHSKHCEDVFKYVVPCVKFEERKEVIL